MKLVFLDSDALGDDIDLNVFRDYGDITVYGTTEDHLIEERVADADIIVTNKVPMNRDTLKNAVNLKLICVAATGYNIIDMDYMKKRKIAVTNVAAYSTDTVVQHTFAMMFYLLEKLSYYDKYVKSGEYAKSNIFTHFSRKFMELSGKTWGIIGLGNIGKKVAAVASAFGCRVIYYSTSGKNSNSEYERVEFGEILKQSDILSVHAPLNSDTEELMNYEAFSQMKNNAIFINVGRGRIVDERGLLRALDENRIAAAGLDVLSEEPMEVSNPLYGYQDSTRLLITPHIAWASYEARSRCVNEVYDNIRVFLEGGMKNRII